jgi:phage-related protein
MRTLRIVNTVRTLTLDTKERITLASGARVSVNSVRTSNVEPRTGARERYGHDGVILTGDNSVGARRLQIGIDITADSDTSYRDAYDDIISMFDSRYAPIYVYDDQDDGGSLPLRARVALSSEDITTQDGLDMRIGRGMINMIMLDGCWETQTEYTASTPSGGIGTGGTLSVTNTSRRIAYPVIEVTAQAANPAFRLTNVTTGEFIELGVSQFNAGSTIVISSIDGSIILNNSDISAASLADGSTLIRLFPGANTLVYESGYANAEITVKWRERWLR